MTPEDKLNALFAHAIEQQETAKTAISEMAKERAQLNKTIESLQTPLAASRRPQGMPQGAR
jgi:hypothetical protein